MISVPHYWEDALRLQALLSVTLTACTIHWFLDKHSIILRQREGGGEFSFNSTMTLYLTSWWYVHGKLGTAIDSQVATCTFSGIPNILCYVQSKPDKFKSGKFKFLIS